MQGVTKLPFLRLELTQVHVCSFVLPSTFSVLFCVAIRNMWYPCQKPLDESLAMDNIGLKKLISQGPAGRGVITYTNISRQGFGLVFWDAQGILFIDYFEKGRTINSKYYIALLVHLKEEITKKRPQNALSPRQCNVSQVDRNTGKTTRIALRIASTPTLFFRSSPQQLWAVCRPQKNAPGKEIWLQWRSDIGKAYFEAKDKKGIELLEKNRNPFITLEGDYVDEESQILPKSYFISKA